MLLLLQEGGVAGSQHLEVLPALVLDEAEGGGLEGGHVGMHCREGVDGLDERHQGVAGPHVLVRVQTCGQLDGQQPVPGLHLHQEGRVGQRLAILAGAAGKGGALVGKNLCAAPVGHQLEHLAEEEGQAICFVGGGRVQQHAHGAEGLGEQRQRREVGGGEFVQQPDKASAVDGVGHVDQASGQQTVLEERRQCRLAVGNI